MKGTENDGHTINYAFSPFREIHQWGNFAQSLLFVWKGSKMIDLSLMIKSSDILGIDLNANS